MPAVVAAVRLVEESAKADRFPDELVVLEPSGRFGSLVPVTLPRVDVDVAAV